MNRWPRGYTGIAVFGIGAMFALSVMSARTLAVARPAVPPAPSAEERAVVASAATDGHNHTHTGSSMLFAPEEDLPIPARFGAAQEPVRPAAVEARTSSIEARSDAPRSLSVTHGDPARKRVSLTFDAGADVGYAADILDTLQRERVVASFGMTGAWAEQHPAIVRRMAAEGHHFINHTWSHDSFTGHSTGRGPKSRAQRWDELDRTEAIIQHLTGATTLPYFRPPYGDSDASVLADVGARGYTITAMWAVDSLGWNGLSAPRIVERTLRLSTPGAILIFHVGSQSQDAAALPAIIRGLREAGYEFVTLKALVER